MSRPHPSGRSQPPPSSPRRRHKSATSAIAGEVPPRASCAPSLCLRHLPRLAVDHEPARPASAHSRHRLCRLRPVSTDPALRKETVRQETPAAPANPQVRSSAPPTSCHLPRVSEAAKPSRAADEATKAPVPAARSTWALPLLLRVMPEETLPATE